MKILKEFQLTDAQADRLYESYRNTYALQDAQRGILVALAKEIQETKDEFWDEVSAIIKENACSNNRNREADYKIFFDSKVVIKFDKEENESLAKWRDLSSGD